MSKFEIVAGVEGDCLVMDGTRIAGPKPWGGGPVVKTFTTDGIYEAIDKKELELLRDKNAKLRELVRELYEMAWYEYPSAFENEFSERIRELGIEVDV